MQESYKSLHMPICDYVIKGSKKKKFGLRPTYLPNPRSGILMPKPPWLKVVATANLRHSFTTLIDYMYVLWTSRCRIKFGIERIYFQAKRIIFECATLRILPSSINLFVWTKKKKTIRALCSAHGCKNAGALVRNLQQSPV